jgi:hypothetical protein
VREREREIFYDLMREREREGRRRREERGQQKVAFVYIFRTFFSHKKKI